LISLGNVGRRRYSSLARRVKAGTCEIKNKPYIKYPQKCPTKKYMLVCKRTFYSVSSSTK